MVSVDTWQEMQLSLEELSSADLLRALRVVDSPVGPEITVDGRRVLCLCSNDYLGLADHCDVKAAAIDAIGRWGFGAGASRLVSGTTSLHVELERRLAGFKNVQAAIVTSTGWMANRAAIGVLAGGGDMILCDKLNHASIIDAAGSCGARLRTYRHGDTAQLESLLERHRAKYKRCLIVTDSLFSMDGDIAPLAEIVDIKRRFDALLLIDEAHATGVMGTNGRGVAEALNLEEHIDATVGTMSKALGSMGGFVAGPQVLIDTIINTAGAFIYTTAPPPATCAAAIAALDIVRNQPQLRERLQALAERLRSGLQKAGMDTGNSASQIVPVMTGTPARAVKISKYLLGCGMFVPAIRPPTVSKGSSRLRVSLSVAHSADDVDRFIKAMKDCYKHE